MAALKLHTLSLKGGGRANTVKGALDGVPLKGCTALSIKVVAGQQAEVSLTLRADLDVDLESLEASGVVVTAAAVPEPEILEGDL